MNTHQFSPKSTRIVAAFASVCTSVLLIVAVVSLSDTAGVLPQMASVTVLTVQA